MDKKTILTLFSYAALAQPLLLLTSCTADEQDGSTSRTPIALTAAMAAEDDATTRAGTDIQSTQFAQGESFYAYFPSNVTVGSTTSGSNTTFTTSNGSGATSPATTPYMNAGQSSATVHAYYPSTVTNATSSFSVQTAQNTDANYKKSDLMYATGTVTKSGSSATGSLTFTHKMAKILVTANIGAGVTNIQSIKIVGGYRTINISTPLSCTLGTSLSNPNSSTNITMWSGTSTNTVNCAALIPPQTISGNFLQIVTDKGTVTYSLSNKAFATAQSYTFNITINAAAIGTTIAITDWGNNGSATVNPTVVNEVYRQAVDLGLSVKWANMNVGASSPTDYGMYFMWGDVAGHPGANDGDGSNDNATDGFRFSWANYKWNPSGDGSTFTKYTGSDYTTLETADDAARANWGGKWRMPTMEEFTELLNNTTKAWTSDYNDTGVAGYTFKANGQTLFLPAAGDRYNAIVERQGYHGYYLSSTYYTDYPDYAIVLDFYSREAYVYSGSRCNGYAVRAVQSN